MCGFGFGVGGVRDEEEDTAFAAMGRIPLLIAIVAKPLFTAEGNFVGGTLDKRGFRAKGGCLGALIHPWSGT